MFFGLLAVVLGMLFYNVLATQFENNFFIIYLPYFLTILGLRIANSFFLQFYLVRGQISYFFKVILFISSLVVLWVGLIYIFELSITSIFIGLIVIESVKFFLLFSKNKRLILDVKGKALVSKSELGYIVPIGLASLITTFNVYLDKFMVSTMLDPKEFAIYQVGAFNIPFIGVITGSIVTALIPVLSRLKSEGKHTEIKNQLKETTKKTTVFLLPILIYCIVLGKFLITSLYSDLYIESGAIFQLYTAIYLLSVLAFSAVLNGIGLQKWVIVNTIINLTVNSVLNFLLIPKFGSLGAIYSTLISVYLGYFFPIYLIKKHLKAGFFEYFPSVYYLRVLLISTSLTIPIYFLIVFFELMPSTAVISSVPYYILTLFVILGYKSTKSYYHRIRNKITQKLR